MHRPAVTVDVRGANRIRIAIEGQFDFPQFVHFVVAYQQVLAVDDVDGRLRWGIADVIVIFTPRCRDRIIDEVVVVVRGGATAAAEYKGDDVADRVIFASDQNEPIAFGWSGGD